MRPTIFLSLYLPLSDITRVAIFHVYTAVYRRYNEACTFEATTCRKSLALPRYMRVLASNNLFRWEIEFERVLSLES